MTSARSGKESPIAPNARRKHQESEQDCNPSDHLAPLVWGAGEVELDAPRSGRELNPYAGVISGADGVLFCRHQWPSSRDSNSPTRRAMLRPVPAPSDLSAPCLARSD